MSRTAPVDAGVVGLGLMGHSIIACLLAAGHRVVAVTRSLSRHRNSRRHIRGLLAEMRRERLTRRDPGRMMQKLAISEDYADLAGCGIVLESIVEDLQTKRRAYRAIEQAVAPDAIVGSNTSAIPVSILQRGALHPERYVGIHWDEPAHVTRFMEVIAGEQTGRRYAERVMELAERWGKEPSLVRRDVRGFITNRVSYAMFREACHLVDSGIATIEDVDRSLRNDVGWWITFAGPFRYMDLMGVEAYYRVMKDLLPELSTSSEIPRVMREAVEAGGFYRYQPGEAKRRAREFLKFNYEIRKLALRYPEKAPTAGSPRPRRRGG